MLTYFIVVQEKINKLIIPVKFIYLFLIYIYVHIYVI